MVNRKLTGNNLHFYLNPGRDSHEEALKVHGISNEFLRDKPAFPAIVEELLQYVAGAEIIIHNAAFDLGFLNQELSQLKRPVFREFVGSVTDTLVMAKEMFPGKRNSLDALCDRLGVDNSGRTLHGALLDAELLADVYVNMTRGQEALLIESSTPQADTTGTSSVDLRRLVLPVLTANAQELEAHADVLRQLDKASGGKTVWQAVGA
jgi:DNA polymerase-3 subunit epsilon